MPSGNIPKSKKLARKYQTQFNNWLNRTRRSTNTPQYTTSQAVRSPLRAFLAPSRTSSTPATSEHMASLPPRSQPNVAKDLGNGTYEIMPYCTPWPKCSYEGGRIKHKKTYRKKKHTKKTKKRKSHRK